MAIDMKSISMKMMGNTTKSEAQLHQAEDKDIAIIGVACKFASANNKEEFWNMLERGEDCIRTFPKARQARGNEFLKHQIRYSKDGGYHVGGYLDEVNEFDNGIFSISPIEASLMSPEQRKFLEVAWEAIEDSGYGGNKIRNSKTGVFLGHSSDFGVPYKEFIDALNPEMSSYAISGNLNSIIASRISYILNLKGPSINVDTACSSSLTAIHLACQSLRRKECDMALVGAAKVDNLPLASIVKKEDEIGITSKDGRTKTFDDSSDGTGLGEGIGVVLLKPLNLARKDRDHIYAVIKGSAINHDGKSANLTSPNPVAQEKVIVEALKDAKVRPETISYIEAHGTGTKLGDPIEIKGITAAYQRYTDKLQYCGIGSVKSNIGHLDNAAGMAGLIKLVLSLQHKELPASINFTKPNKNINFEASPLYVNHTHQKWNTDGKVRRCAISAFGLSGTNCHMILEEAPVQKAIHESNNDYVNRILMISAKDKERVKDYVWKYQRYLYQNPEVNLDNLCYTANTGREKYSSRLAIIFHDSTDLRSKLETAILCQLTGLEEQDIFFGENSIISDKQIIKGKNDLTMAQKVSLDEELKKQVTQSKEKLENIATLYVKGADVDFELLYRNEKYEKISLPSYPFEKKSYWIETKARDQVVRQEEIEEVKVHPILHRCIASSYDRITYSSKFNVKDYWILNEHKVAHIPLIPGTTYLEMVAEAVKRNYLCHDMELSDVVFLTPFVLEEKKTAEAQTIIRNEDGQLEFSVASKVSDEERWKIHTQGKIQLLTSESERILDIDEIKKRCPNSKLKEYPYEKDEAIELGKRWNCIDQIWAGEKEILAHLSMKEEYAKEVASYNMHPALLDEAANLALRTIGEGVYLPFSYKRLVILKPLTQKIYSYVKYKTDYKSVKEVAVFDVIITDEAGNELVRAYDYTIKRMNPNTVSRKDFTLYEKKWVSKINQDSQNQVDSMLYLLIKRENETYIKFTETLKQEALNYIEVLPSEFDKIEIKDGEIGGYHSCQIIDICDSMKDFKDELLEEDKKFNKNLGEFIDIVKFLSKHVNKTNLLITILGQYGQAVKEEQKVLNPFTACMYGFAKAINNEYNHIKFRCVDYDQETSLETILSEIKTEIQDFEVAYRMNERYVCELNNSSISKKKTEFTIRENGVYLITGGMGGMGLEISRFLAQKEKVNLVLINRKPFPDEREWDNIVKYNKDLKTIEKIIKLRELQKMGARIVTYAADISDYGHMSTIIQEIEAKIGKINGVVHAAGVAGNGFIERKSKKEIDNVLLPKVRGTVVLDQALQDVTLDFFALCSSISSIIPEAGQSDYCAANCFLDAFASYRSKLGRRVIAINWPAWSEVGMAVDYGVDFSKENFKPIGIKEANDVFDSLIASEKESAIVGPIHYQNYMKNKGYSFISLSKEIVAKNAFGQTMNDNRVLLKSKQNINLNDVKLVGDTTYTDEERLIANIIGNDLGLKEVNIYNSFMELGGNSIIAVKVEMDLEEQGIGITISDLYAYGSIKELAKSIRKNSSEEVTNQEVKANVNNDTKSADESVMIDGIEPFTDIIYKGCFFSAFLPAAKLLTPNYFAYLINDIIYYDFADSNDISSFGVFYKMNKTFEELALITNIQVETAIACDHVVENIKEAISSRNLVIISVDCYYESIRQDMFGKEHWPHNLLIYGYNDARNTFFVIEHKNSGSTLYEKKEVSYHDIEESYQGFLENFKHLDIVNSNVFDLLYDDNQEFPSYFKIHYDANKENVSKVGDMKSMYMEFIKENEDLYFDGYDKLYDYLNKLGNLITNENDIKEKCESLLESINKIVTGRYIERFRIQQLFQEEMSLNEIIQKTVKAWEKLRNSLLKYSYSHVYTENLVTQIQNMTHEILENEKFFYDDIKNM